MIRDNTCLTLTATLFALGLCLAQTSRAAVVGHYALDETSGTTAVDTGGAPLQNGVYQGGPTLGMGGATLSTGSSVLFDGGNDEVFLSSPAKYALGNNFSITAWVNPDAPGGVQRIFSHFPGAGGGYGFGLNGSGLRFTTFGVLDYNTPGGLVSANKWQHVAVTFDSSNDARFYVDGSLVSTIAGANPANAPGGNFFVGRNGGAEGFDGPIDDVQLHSGVLTAGQISTIAGTRGGLLAHYKLDEQTNPSGNTSAADASGRSNTGTYQPLGGPGPIVGQPGAGTLTGTSARFNGTNDEIIVGNQPDFNMKNEFTISAWINPDDTNGTQRVFSQDSIDATGYGFGLFGDELRFTSYGVLDYTTSGVDVAAGEWTHVAVVFDDDNDASFYVNGEFVQTIAHNLPARLDTVGRNFFIGSTGRSEYFDGLIDDLQFYQGSLSASEISAIFLAANSAPEPSTLMLVGFAIAGLMMRRRRRS